MKNCKFILSETAGIIAGGILGSAISGLSEAAIQVRKLADGKVFEEELREKVAWSCAKGAVVGASATALASMTNVFEKRAISHTITGLGVLVGASVVGLLMYKLRGSEEENLFSYHEFHDDEIYGLRVEEELNKFDGKCSTTAN